MSDIKRIARKVASLLCSDEYFAKDKQRGRVTFDFNSYDDENDIPHLVVDGRRINVFNVGLKIEGDQLILSILTNEDDGIYDNTIDLNTLSEKELEDMGLYTLLQDMYYETELSYEIGDFELNFLREY